MSERVSRRVSAAIAEPSPLNGSKKRAIDETQDESSPLRRSKRTRSATDITTTSFNGKGAGVNVKQECNGERPFKNNAENSRVPIDRSPRSKRNTTQSTKTQVKIEENEGAESVKVKHTDRIQISAENEADHKCALEVEGEGEEETVTKKKVTRKRKTKQEKEAEEMPLAARSQGLRMFVGAHVSAAKGVQNSVTNSVHIGGNAFALFLKSQRKWDNPPLQDDHRDHFQKFCIDHKYDAAKYILPHGSYLVNLAQDDKAKAKQAYDSFLDDLRRCEQLGITLYNFHPGTANQTTHSSAITRLAKALTSALSETSTVIPVLETMCGHGTTIGGNLSDLGSVISQIPPEYQSRIGVCIDTCHSFAYGYDLASPAGFQSFMAEFEKVIEFKFLRALHLNDSKAPRGSKRDLHANIGTGFLGLRAFHNVMNEKRFEGLPMILETPIDRPNPSFVSNGSAHGVKAEDESDVEVEVSDDSPKKGKKPASKVPKRTPTGTKKPPTIEDKSVWAREIKLLESLIGMDPESADFQELEARLSEEGRAERERIQDQYDRKLETAEKKRKKEAEKVQRSLVDMMKGSKEKRKSKKDSPEPTSGEESDSFHGRLD